MLFNVRNLWIKNFKILYFTHFKIYNILKLLVHTFFNKIQSTNFIHYKKYNIFNAFGPLLQEKKNFFKTFDPQLLDFCTFKKIQYFKIFSSQFMCVIKGAAVHFFKKKKSTKTPFFLFVTL